MCIYIHIYLRNPIVYSIYTCIHISLSLSQLLQLRLGSFTESQVLGPLQGLRISDGPPVGRPFLEAAVYILLSEFLEVGGGLMLGSLYEVSYHFRLY